MTTPAVLPMNLTKKKKKNDSAESSRKRRKNEPLDRISALPDSLLHHILSLLPMNEVVQTGTLSKRWQFLWTSVSNLVFRLGDTSDYSIRKFIPFVDKTLVVHDSSKIKEFSIDFPYRSNFASAVSVWIRFAMNSNVEELNLNLWYRNCPISDQYKLPEYVYTSSSLVKMSLSKCMIVPNGAISWKSLKSLTIKFAELSEAAIQKISSGCPALEFLEFCICRGVNRFDINSTSLKKLVIRNYLDPSKVRDGSVLEISAPSVLSLDIVGCFCRRKLRLVNVSSLVDAKLECTQVIIDDDRRNDFKAQQDMLMDLLVSLQHVKDLTLGPWCIQVLSILEMKGLSSLLSKRKCLTLETQMKEWDLPGIARLLRSSPELETLVINMASPYFEFHFGAIFPNAYNFDGEEYWTSRHGLFRCLELHLKTVKIAGFGGGSCACQLPFVEFLLKNAGALEKMVINARRVGHNQCWRCCSSDEVLQVAQKLLSFPRSSQDAVIMFME